MGAAWVYRCRECLIDKIVNAIMFTKSLVLDVMSTLYSLDVHLPPCILNCNGSLTQLMVRNLPWMDAWLGVDWIQPTHIYCVIIKGGKDYIGMWNSR